MEASRINLIGVELEGGWNKFFPVEDPTEIYADHSVRLQGFKHVGEVASPPLSLSDALKWVSEHYPSGYDASCGMHIHLSLKEDADYVSLCRTPHFFMKFLLWGNSFLSSLKGDDKALFRTRISGGNRFCALKFIPEKQLALVRKGGGNNVDVNARYAMLNFAKNVHGTVENRVFPLFREKEVALRAISEYVELTEKFLKDYKRKKEIVGFSL